MRVPSTADPAASRPGRRWRRWLLGAPLGLTLLAAGRRWRRWLLGAPLGLTLLATGCLDLDALQRCAREDCGASACWRKIVAGWTHACALRQADGAVWCWGHNNAGQLAEPGISVDPTPRPIPGLGESVALAAGDSFTCVVRSDGHVLCWGYNDAGQIGLASPAIVHAPSLVPGLDDVADVAAGFNHACALRRGGTVACWGGNAHGELGDGTTTGHFVPAPVVGLSGVTGVAVGFQHSCALQEDGSVWCWGSNAHGQLGDGATKDSPEPVKAQLAGAARLAAALYHSCVIKGDGTVWCWGLNNTGQLGDHSTADSSSPVRAGTLDQATELSLSGVEQSGLRGRSCARRVGGSVWCWGSNLLGELGDGTTDPYGRDPSRVVVIADATAIAAGSMSTCAVRRTGGVWCWGANQKGQLGNGGFEDSRLPVPSLLTCP